LGNSFRKKRTARRSSTEKEDISDGKEEDSAH
jgi:hypothetical protein